MDPKRLGYCGTCASGRAPDDPPPCSTCPCAKGPDLKPENRDAMRLWLAAGTQWRSAGFGLVGLDYAALALVAGLLRPPVDLDPHCFDKIQALERFELARAAKGKGS